MYTRFQHRDISIHALREEGDGRNLGGVADDDRFLSTPSARRATVVPLRPQLRVVFLSTPSARRATPATKGQKKSRVFLSTPSARRATSVAHHNAIFQRISIHALREEGDVHVVVQQRAVALFLSTPSARRATWIFDGLKCTLKRFLSTPSARRATGALTANLTTAFDFYPRPPRGGRRWIVGTTVTTTQFLSTPSARRATASGGLQKALKNISIHALREEGDAMLFFSGSKHRKFLSTPSARRATSWVVQCFAPLADFYPRPPRGGRPMPP